MVSGGKGLLIGGVVFLVLVLAGVTVYFSVYGKSQVVIPQYCYKTDSFSTSSSYRCPSGSSGCDVTVNLSCSSPTSTPKVTARTNSPNYWELSHWIVVRNKYDNLES